MSINISYPTAKLIQITNKFQQNMKNCLFMEYAKVRMKEPDESDYGNAGNKEKEEFYA